MQVDTVGAGKRWIPEEEYAWITRRVPIPCVDLLPLFGDESVQIGLILRATADGGRGWCLIGGAILIDEPLESAIRRHLSVTLGAAVELRADTLQLATIVEYFSQPGIGEFHDPRKHAIAHTYAAVCIGTPQPAGEALDFHLFAPDGLPPAAEFGFGQDRVVKRVLRELGLN